MKYIGIHKINGFKIYKHEEKYYLFEEDSDSFIRMQTLTETQKMMLKALHSDDAKILYQR